MSDRIEKSITIKASPSRVWKALTDHTQFSTWFRAKIDRPFEEGKTSHGKVAIPGYEHLKFVVMVRKITPETYFAYAWHPYPSDPDFDYSVEDPTLVEFTLTPTADGTLLKVVESGFGRIPAHRRPEAFRMNTGGWEGQIKNIKDYAES